MNRRLLAMLLCAACHAPSTPPPAKAPGAEAELQMQVRRLENARAIEVAKVLEEKLASRSASGVGFKVAVQPDQNAVILSGTTAQIHEALQIVAQLDTRSGR